MYKDGIPMYTVYLGSGIRVPLLANYYNYSQNPKVRASSGGFGALQQYFDKLAVQQNMLYFSGTTTNAERALWNSLWKDTVPNMSFSQVVDVWLGMTQLTGGVGLSAKDAMTATAYVSLYTGVNTGAAIQEAAHVLVPDVAIVDGELMRMNLSRLDVEHGFIETADKNAFFGLVSWALEKLVNIDIKNHSIESQYDYYIGRLIGDVVTGLAGITEAAEGIALIIAAIGGGGVITVGTGGAAVSIGGVVITAGAAAGSIMVQHGGNNNCFINRRIQQ